MTEIVSTAQTLLAFDAAGGACSAALWRHGQVVARRFEVMRRGQAERLVPMILEVMGEAECNFAQLDALAVTTGPGAFTGVRIGLAAARGLALATGLPQIGVTCFEAVAAAHGQALRPGQRLAVVLDAKRSDVYFQSFDADLQILCEPLAIGPADLLGHLPGASWLVVGDGVGQVRDQLADSPGITLSQDAGVPDAFWVAYRAGRREIPGPGAAMPQPLYLRAPDVTPAVPR